MRLRLLIFVPPALAALAFLGTSHASAGVEVSPPGTARPAGHEELFLPDPLRPVPEMDLGILREEEAPDTSTPPDPEEKARLVEEGRRLFFSGTAFAQKPSEGPQVRGQILSCSSCHLGPGFVDGRSHLIGPTDAGPVFLEEQARGAITSNLEMNSGREPTVRELAAIAAFVESIEPPPAVPGRDFDPKLAKFGERVFKDKRGVDPSGEFSPNVKISCETCHLGPAFTDNKPHRIALPFPLTGDPAFDPGQVDGEGKIRGFDTPPLLGVRFTAPYFHDGLAGDPTAPTNLLTGGEPARRALRDNLIPFYNARFAFNFTQSEMDALTEFLLSLSPQLRRRAGPGKRGHVRGSGPGCPHKSRGTAVGYSEGTQRAGTPDKGKPVGRRGRKATGPITVSGCIFRSRRGQPGCLEDPLSDGRGLGPRLRTRARPDIREEHA